MSSLNRVILIGRVATPPELRYTTTGKAVASFRMAVDRRGRSGGENNADFIPVVAWERLAEICNEFLTKGKLIAIEGRLQTRTYETPEGQKRSAFDVVADDMRMLGSRSESEGAGGGGQYNRPPRSNEAYRAPREGGSPAASASEPKQTGPSHEFGDDFETGLGVDDEVPF